MRTMSPDVRGPVSVRQFAEHAAAVLRAVRENGQVVPLTSRGRVVAVIQPATTAQVLEVVDLDDDEAQVSSRTLERGGISASLRSVQSGLRLAVTRQNRPFALLIPATEWADLDALFSHMPQTARLPRDALHEGSSADGRLATE